MGNFLCRQVHKIGDCIASQLFHQQVGGSDRLFRRACIVRRSALGDDTADIALSLGDERKQRDAAATCGFTEDL